MKRIFQKFQNHIYLFIILSLSTFLSLIIVVFRIFYSGEITYIFLIWNLFLAWIPFILALLIRYLYLKGKSSKIIIGILAFFWLLFFPNAPYIVTDFFHLIPRDNIPPWYDLILIFSFAWNGLILGFISLYIIHDMVRKKWGKVYGWCLAIFAIILGSFGIYLGRFQRWNSWDIISQPLNLLKNIADIIINPFSHPRTMGVTLFFSLFFIISYITLVLFLRLKEKRNRL